MIFPFFVAAFFLTLLGTGWALSGWNPTKGERVQGIAAYLSNLLFCLTVYTGGGLAFMWIYVKVLGMPGTE